MKLRTRMVLGMLACSVIPLFGARYLARRELAQPYEQADATLREAAVSRVERTLEARAAAQNRQLARFCAHDHLVDRTLLQLGAGQWGEAAREELNSVLPEVGAALGLDVLQMVRPDGEILASAHYPGQVGRHDADTFRLASRAHGERWVRRVRVRDRTGPHDVLALESFCVARRGTVAVAVAGGKTLDARWLQDITGERGGVTARLVEGAATAPGPHSRVLALRGPDGRTVASVVVQSATDQTLRALVAELDKLVAVSALIAAVTALLMALLLAPPLARPLVQLAEAADRIAKGDRTVQLRARAGGEVGRLVAAFNHMTHELDAADARLRRAERLAAWRDIARQMAHEIKNPLTPIRMAVEMLRRAREQGSEDFDEMFDEESRIVLDEVERLRRLVESFSQFARAPRPKPEPVALAEVAAHVVELHAGGPVEVTQTVEGEAPSLRADRDQLTQVLVNLVANACQAAEERTRLEPARGPAKVQVTVYAVREGRVRVTVEDNGAGLPPQVLARLFEPYVTTKPGGTGLGLAIVYKIVTDHGGSVAPESLPGGTRFVVDLPVGGPPEPAPEAPPASGPEGN